MGHLYVASGPGNGRVIAQTEDVHYVCGQVCLVDAISEHVSVLWATVCDEVSAWAHEGERPGDRREWNVLTFMIAFDPNESPSDDHEYCWACGDLVSHSQECTVDPCDAPAYVEV